MNFKADHYKLCKKEIKEKEKYPKQGKRHP